MGHSFSKGGGGEGFFPFEGEGSLLFFLAVVISVFRVL